MVRASRATRPGFLLAPRRPRANTRDGSSSPDAFAFAFASPSPSLTLRLRLRREHFRCWNDERPAVVDLPTYAGLVVTGSHHGCNDAHAWIRNLRAFLRHVVEEHPRVRILATCFGHQLLAQALGGAAGPNPGGAFVLRRESLECEDAMLRRDDFRAAAAMFPPASAASEGLRRIRVIESHGDCVTSLPPGATLLASSSTAAVEAFAIGDVALAWQGHPELSAAAIERKILPFVTSRLSAEEREAAVASWSVGGRDDALLLVAMARGFLRGGTCDGDNAEVVTTHYERADEIFRGNVSSSASAGTIRVAADASVDDAATTGFDPATSLADAAEATFLKVSDAVRADVDAVSAEFRHLAAMNQSAGARYAAIGRQVGDAHVFADKVRKVQETGIAPQLARLEEIEASVGSLENVANALDARCAELERRFARVVNGEVGDA